MFELVQVHEANGYAEILVRVKRGHGLMKAYGGNCVLVPNPGAYYSPAEDSEKAGNTPQQLQAKIRSVADRLEEHCRNRSYVLLDGFVAELRELSAVQ